MYLLFVYPNLVQTMKERGVGVAGIADICNIKYHAAYRRLRGLSEWKLHETIRVCQHFDVSDTAWLFERCDTISQNF